MSLFNDLLNIFIGCMDTRAMNRKREMKTNEARIRRQVAQEARKRGLTDEQMEIVNERLNNKINQQYDDFDKAYNSWEIVKSKINNYQDRCNNDD